MQLEARMTCQPALDGRVLMGGVIIQNDVDVLAQRNFAVDLLEKFQPLSQNFASKSGSVESLKTRVRCGLISFSLQTRCTVALETPNSRAIARQVHRARPCGGRVA